MRILPVFIAVPLLVIASSAHAQDSGLRSQEQSSVYVDPLNLTEVQNAIGFGLNIGAIVSDEEVARGLQKAADVYGIKLDLLVSENSKIRRRFAETLIRQGESGLIFDGELDIDLPSGSENVYAIEEQLGATEESERFDLGFTTLRRARAAIVNEIPKYEQVLPYAFPVSPLPDTFFQPSKFPYPTPLVRAPRTNESFSASVHAHTSCNMVAQTGNMLHRTSSFDRNRLLMGMEGTNLSLHAMEGAIDAPKISAVMTSWVLNIAERGAKRDVLVENNGLESSLFKPGIHAPEELAIGLEAWMEEGMIGGYDIIDHETVRIQGWDGKDRVLEAGMFLIANDRSIDGPVLHEGHDRFGAKTIDFYSTQAFVQQLVERISIDEALMREPVEPQGGILTSGGTSTNLIGMPLSEMLWKTEGDIGPVPSYVMRIEGGYLITTPEIPLTDDDLTSPVNRVHLDLRGPLTSDQTITVYLDNGKQHTFRRTVLDFMEIDQALNLLRSMGMISGWDFEGARGRGLHANLVLYDYLGKHRKFMSSLGTWPIDETVQRPLLRFYVDGMQRLNFSFLTTYGWRQEFVEVPMRIPPVPRDVALFTGRSTLN